MSDQDYREKLLIIGGGQAGGRLVKSLINNGYSGTITLAAEEMYYPYERPPLSKKVLKESSSYKDGFILSDEDSNVDGLDIKLGCGVVCIDYNNKNAKLSSGEVVAWDKVVLATGGRARNIPIPGLDLCFVLRNLNDSLKLSSALKRSNKVVVIGGGVIGLEFASSARELGCEVTVIEASDRVMGRVLPPAASKWLQNQFNDAGIHFVFNSSVRNIKAEGEGFFVDVENETIESDIVLAATGMQPNSELAPGLSLGKSGGVVTDSKGKVVGFNDVYAIGDLAERWNDTYKRYLRLETWRNSENQARALANLMCGADGEHHEIPWMWTDLLGMNIQVVGLWDNDCETVFRGSFGEKGSALFWHKNGNVLGGVLVDSGRDRRFLEKMVISTSKVNISSLSDTETELRSVELS